MKSLNASPTPVQPSCEPIRLGIRGSHVPSFKNSKVIGRKRLFTKPEYAKWMKECVDSFEWSLRSLYQTTGKGTQTGLSLPSWIASAIPLDDSVREIPQIEVQVVKVQKGNEGADVEITNL